MTNYTGAVPETKRKPDWRDQGACQTEDPELFFPGGNGIEAKLAVVEAKKICLRCPSRDECLTFALDERVPFGIFGGLTEDERYELRTSKGKLKPEDIEAARQPITLESVFTENIRELPDGHVEWLGGKTVCYAGVYFTPRQVAFEVGRGTRPYGHVHTTCGRLDCVAPDHMEDQHERHMRQLTEEPAA
jgi:hypothetical protein